MDKPFRISIINIIQIIALGLGLWFLYLIRDILVIIFIAWVASTILQPIVDRMQIKHVPRSVTASVLVIAVVGFLILFVISSIPLFTAQFDALVESGPGIINSLIETFNLQRFASENTLELEQSIPEIIFGQIGAATDTAFAAVRFLTDSVVSILVVSFLTFYFLTDKDVVKNLVLYFAPNKEMATDIYSRIETKLRVWMQGQGIVMILIGLVTYIGLVLLGIEYALPLAVFAGVLEIVPLVGPTISAIPALLIALTISPIKTISVLLLYFAIQQIEASVVVPRVMNRAIGLNPIIVILAVMIGSRLLGIAGGLLAIPFAAMVTIAFDEYRAYRERKHGETDKLASFKLVKDEIPKIEKQGAKKKSSPSSKSKKV